MNANVLRGKINAILEMNIPPSDKLALIEALTKSQPCKPISKPAQQAVTSQFLGMADRIINSKR